MAFYVKLKKFFEKHDPERLYLVRKIVRNFAANEDDVMARLEDIYSNGGPSKLKSTARPKINNLGSQTSFSSNDSDEISHDIQASVNTEPVKKSKKKFIIIVIIALLLLVGGYFGYTTFFSVSSDETNHTEETHDTNDHAEVSAPVGTENEKPEEKTVTVDTVVALDSTNPIDSTNTIDSTEAVETIEVIDVLGH